MREVINLHIGQAGVQIGSAVWELLCIEHGVCENGYTNEGDGDTDSLNTFFVKSSSNRYTPRCLFIDLEPTVMDEIRCGPFNQIFHPDRLISGPEDAASNFARGFFTVGKLILNKISNEIRRIIEMSEHVHAIMMFRALGGGTGSGLTSAIFDSLAEYPKTTKLEIPIYPSSTLSSSTVEPYNCLLAQHFCMEDIDIGLLIENEAIYNVCMRSLKEGYPTFNLINRLLAQICSNLTVSLRFENTICFDLSVMQNNLVPYPRIHFPIISFAPILPTGKSDHETLSILDLTRSVFDTENQLMKIDTSFGKFMSCAINYRGPISPYHVYNALSEIKRDNRIEFVDWCPTGFKVGINVYPPVVAPGSLMASSSRNATLLTNTSAIGQAWQRLTHKFYLLYSKRSFVHWYVGEGMEECEFTESLYNISSLVKDYEECTTETEEDRDEETIKSEDNKGSMKQSMKNSMEPSVRQSAKKSTNQIEDEEIRKSNRGQDTGGVGEADENIGLEDIREDRSDDDGSDCRDMRPISESEEKELNKATDDEDNDDRDTDADNINDTTDETKEHKSETDLTQNRETESTPHIYDIVGKGYESKETPKEESVNAYDEDESLRNTGGMDDYTNDQEGGAINEDENAEEGLENVNEEDNPDENPEENLEENPEENPEEEAEDINEEENLEINEEKDSYLNNEANDINEVNNEGQDEYVAQNEEEDEGGSEQIDNNEVEEADEEKDDSILATNFGENDVEGLEPEVNAEDEEINEVEVDNESETDEGDEDEDDDDDY